MKTFTFILLAFCLAGCTKFEHVDFTGVANGVKSGVFIVKDLGGKAVYGEVIKDGKFNVENKVLEVPGYYMLDVIDDATRTDAHPAFEVYLQNGKYTIEADAAHISAYPRITSTSAIQNELSAFYTLADKMNGNLTQEANRINARIHDKSTVKMPKDQYIALLNQVSAIDEKRQKIMPLVFKKFVDEHPQNVTGAHLMLKQEYESDPLAYNAIYQKLSTAVKSSDDGKELGEKLGRLVKLVPGATAPVIAGKLLNGKSFDPASMHKRIFLIDFWRAANEISRRNHAEIGPMLKELGNGFEVVSIGMDSKDDWWRSAVKEDGMTWTQISDLKGDDSPNTLNWSVTAIPRYDLVDGNWHIIERDVPFGSIYMAVQAYLKKHR